MCSRHRCSIAHYHKEDNDHWGSNNDHDHSQVYDRCADNGYDSCHHGCSKRYRGQLLCRKADLRQPVLRFRSRSSYLVSAIELETRCKRCGRCWNIRLAVSDPPHPNFSHTPSFGSPIEQVSNVHNVVTPRPKSRPSTPTCPTSKRSTQTVEANPRPLALSLYTIFLTGTVPLWPPTENTRLPMVVWLSTRLTLMLSRRTSRSTRILKSPL